MTIYMQIKGIPGNVTAKNYQHWIELESFHFLVQRQLNTQPGRISNREGSKPRISEIVVNKRLDKSSSLLFGEATVGIAKPEVNIHFITTNISPQAYLEYTLSNTIISGHEISQQAHHSSTDVEYETYPLETIHLNFDKIEMKVIPFDKNHKPESPIPAGYDLNSAIST